MRPEQSPLVVAGMHRSGTSLVASLLAEAGIDMGKSIPADEGNTAGYFEDRGFLALNRRILKTAVRGGKGHSDWGWVESEELDTECFADYHDSASSLLRSRASAAGPWGFKDPRSTLLLDFWEQASGGALYLLVYRYPWDVANSMQRLPADLFRRHPSWAYRIWLFYNDRLLRFALRHRGRCLLVSVNAVVRQQERFCELVRQHFRIGLEAHAFQATLDPARLRTVDGTDPLIGLVSAAYPQCVGLLCDLDQAADLPATELWNRPKDTHRAKTGLPVDLSVVVPCFNDGPLLIDAVASFARHAPRSSELIVVDDGSDDPEALEVFQVMAESGYRIIHQQNLGLSAARNRGFEEARGRYVLPLDADNRLAPGFLERAIRTLDQSPELGVVHGDWQEFGDRDLYRESRDFDLETILRRGNYIDACAVVRKEAWQDVAGYDAELRHMEDWDLWIRMGKRGWGFRRLPQLTFEYCVRPDSLTNAERREFAVALDHLLRKHPEMRSLAWRMRWLGLRYAGWRDRLLPPGTRRRRALGRMMDLLLARG